MARCQDGYPDFRPKEVLPSLPPEAESCERWKRLDGFQRLCWLAFARAVAEPELAEIAAVRSLVDQQSLGSTLYLDQLAVELYSAAAPHWLQPQAGFADAFLLAFHYLDCDTDGVLSAGDLAQHAVGEDARHAADLWVARWRPQLCEGLPLHAARGLAFADFRRALRASCGGEAAPQASLEGADGPKRRVLGGQRAADAAGGSGRGRGDAVLEKRMQAIDEVCQRFLDEEFDDFGYGF